MKQFYSPQHAFVELLRDVHLKGETITVRGSETKELRNVAFNIVNPHYRCLLLPERNDNIFAKIAETLWVLAGRNDISWLKFFLPRAPEWSDDGITWRAGYGPRLRMWTSIGFADWGYKRIDQLNECRKLLVDDRYTRRAVMSLWDPSLDYQTTLDTPCNNWLHWLIRDRWTGDHTPELHLSIAQRSSDVLWGMSGINLFEWGVMQELMAHWTGCLVGELSYFITSLHLYAKHYERAIKILNADSTHDLYNMRWHNFRSPAMTVPFEKFDDMLADIFKMVDTIIAGEEPLAVDWKVEDPFFDLCAKMICLHAFDKVHKDHPKRIDILLVMLDSLPTSDFRVAAIEYYLRHVPEVISIATEEEVAALRSLRLLARSQATRE